jgi:hypothetical protein
LKNLDPIRTDIHLRRANSFFDAMRSWDGRIRPEQLSTDAAVALLAVHGSISLNDAIQIALQGGRSKYEDHGATISDLKRICIQNGVNETRGVEHLEWLLTRRTDISYSDKHFAYSDAALDHAEKFYRWAYNHFREVLLVQDRA